MLFRKPTFAIWPFVMLQGYYIIFTEYIWNPLTDLVVWRGRGAIARRGVENVKSGSHTSTTGLIAKTEISLNYAEQQQEEEEEENLAPMTESELKELRLKLRLNKEMWMMIHELSTYIVFLALLTFIAYGNIDIRSSIYLKKSIVNQMEGQGDTINIRNVRMFIAGSSRVSLMIELVVQGIYGYVLALFL